MKNQGGRMASIKRRLRSTGANKTIAASSVLLPQEVQDLRRSTLAHFFDDVWTSSYQDVVNIIMAYMVQPMIVLVGGLRMDCSGGTSTAMEIYDPSTALWQSITLAVSDLTYYRLSLAASFATADSLSIMDCHDNVVEIDLRTSNFKTLFCSPRTGYLHWRACSAMNANTFYAVDDKFLVRRVCPILAHTQPTQLPLPTSSLAEIWMCNWMISANGQLWIHRSSTAANSDFRSVNVDNGKIEILPPPPASPDHHSAITTCGDVIYAAFGRVLNAPGVTSITRGFFKYDIANKTWTELANMLRNRLFAAAVWLEDKVYLLGGVVESTCIQEVDCYNIRTNTWSMVTKWRNAKYLPTSTVCPSYTSVT
jgi:hypothetical protein